MVDFSIVLQAPEIRGLVQENILERAFHDALFPRTLFRAEATPVPWPAGVGDSMIFTAAGLIPVDARPLTPGTDPTPVTYPNEQWTAQLQQYAATIDTNMPTSMLAISNLFMRNAHQLGVQAAQTMNRIVRNKMYAAALSGNTVADGAQTSTATLRVKRLNGFTRARNPSTSGASLIKYDLVSSTNPLAVTIFDNGSAVSRNVIGFTPDTAGDEQGPGTVTLNTTITSVADRGYVIAGDASSIVRVGGGFKVDDVGSNDIPTLADVRSAVATMWSQNVPEHPDGYFHCHLDPISMAKVFADAEFQRLMTSLPDYYAYKQFALGQLLNTVFFRNQECPTSDTVVGGSTATYDQRDPFVGELFNTGVSSGVKIHRMLFTGQGGIFEYHSDMSQLMTDAGITGAIADPRIVNNGIEIMTDRIQFIIRAPLNRLQDQISTTWKFIGDWPVRTDGATGSAARYKRTVCIEHGE